MEVVRSIHEYSNKGASAVTVGTFDGVHIGHRAILATVLEHGRSKGLRTMVVTFEPHPRTIVGRGPVRLLTTLEERLELFRAAGLESVCVINFTYEFSRLSPGDFFQEYIVKGFGAREMIIGHDHMFGRDRAAGVQELQRLSHEHGISPTIVEPVKVDGEVVSSSSIRDMLLRGDVGFAGRCLLRPYSLSGRVVHGDGRGALLGFPTANIQVADEQKVIPLEGVYVVSLDISGKPYFGMMDIGVRPTFDKGNERVLEVHIFQFTGTLYGEQIRVNFLQRLRGERKFASKEELIAQLERDRAESVNFILETQSSTVN